MERNIAKAGTPRARAQVAAGVVALCALACAHGQDAQQPQPERLSTPRNAASQRYEINQTFGGQAYFKDNNVWVYDKDFAELFGMPAKYIEGIQGVAAAAFRLEEAPFQECGFGGRDEACRKVEYCYLDLYFDESKTPLPWASELRSQWLPRYGSTRWLRPLDTKERPYGMTAPDTPPGVVRNEVVVSPLVGFADPTTKRHAIFTTNQYDAEGDAESISSAMAELGYSRGFYRSISIVSLQMGCTPFARTSVNIRLDAKRDVFGKPIARFNRIFLPEGFVQRIKDVIETRRQRNTEFYRSLFPPPLGTRGTAPAASQVTQ